MEMDEFFRQCTKMTELYRQCTETVDIYQKNMEVCGLRQIIGTGVVYFHVEMAQQWLMADVYDGILRHMGGGGRSLSA